MTRKSVTGMFVILSVIAFAVTLIFPFFENLQAQFGVVTQAQISDPTTELYPTCAVRPNPQQTQTPELGPPVETPVSLYRFRRPINWQNSAASAVPAYTPANEYQAIANQTNYGQRYLYDLQGKPATNQPIVVLHETATDAYSTIRFFQTYQNSEDNQATYHTLITRTGDIVYIVPPDLRAFGAGNSVFMGQNGAEAVKTSQEYPPSVNNFAYHISLESPPDGYQNTPSHSGYTMTQYQSLAWLVSRTGIPDNRITTHQAVDRSGERSDPRNFDRELFLQLLQSYPKVREIVIECQAPGINRG
ncbi:MAG: peptidoglycan recognition family protein [Microcoleaceae cyanobacterium]